jgi:ABC-2 type transport system ATP-binding protein
VRVRTSEPARLQEALRLEKLDTTPNNDHALLVHGATSERVGEIAFAAGIPLHELVSEGSSLEEIFLELTSSEVTS